MLVVHSALIVEVLRFGCVFPVSSLRRSLMAFHVHMKSQIDGKSTLNYWSRSDFVYVYIGVIVNVCLCVCICVIIYHAV